MPIKRIARLKPLFPFMIEKKEVIICIAGIAERLFQILYMESSHFERFAISADLLYIAAEIVKIIGRDCPMTAQCPAPIISLIGKLIIFVKTSPFLANLLRLLSKMRSARSMIFLKSLKILSSNG